MDGLENRDCGVACASAEERDKGRLNKSQMEANEGLESNVGLHVHGQIPDLLPLSLALTAESQAQLQRESSDTESQISKEEKLEFCGQWICVMFPLDFEV
uniref:Uncharacterized protein n=1 Tax=Timema bartmani TaxID=61472 RepID=A0A7R9HVB9_9NEOP|nr:unnamed protein product [Timema bartmani]